MLASTQGPTDIDLGLADKRVWVTGASRGLGATIALGFAAAGARLALTARRMESLALTADSIRAGGGSPVVIPASVNDRQGVERAHQVLDESWGGIDVLVNCAGISPYLRRSEETSQEEWCDVIDVNLTGTFLCAQAAGRMMLRGGGGAIVNVSSVHGRSGAPRLAAYSASKGAVDALTRTLAAEWADRGVRVNAVSPGYLETDLTAGLQQNPVQRRRITDRTPLGRFGSPQEVVGAVLYLASAQAAFVTGANLVVDGGWTAL